MAMFKSLPYLSVPFRFVIQSLEQHSMKSIACTHGMQSMTCTHGQRFLPIVIGVFLRLFFRFCAHACVGNSIRPTRARKNLWWTCLQRTVRRPPDVDVLRVARAREREGATSESTHRVAGADVVGAYARRSPSLRWRHGWSCCCCLQLQRQLAPAERPPPPPGPAHPSSETPLVWANGAYLHHSPSLPRGEQRGASERGHRHHGAALGAARGAGGRSSGRGRCSRCTCWQRGA